VRQHTYVIDRCDSVTHHQNVFRPCAVYHIREIM
jgi:hypothetical protein